MCLPAAQIGGVAETVLSIRRHAALQMHNVMMRTVEAVEPAPQVWFPETRSVDLLPACGHSRSVKTICADE